MELLLSHVEPSTFTMGSPPTELGRREDEILHTVTLSRPCALAVLPVTLGLWEAVCGSPPEARPEWRRLPVDRVTWLQAVRFCNRVSERLGFRPYYRIGEGTSPEVVRDAEADGFRLPTEAEWECAARAGASSTFSGGEQLGKLGWYFSNANGEPRPVGFSNPTAGGSTT